MKADLTESTESFHNHDSGIILFAEGIRDITSVEKLDKYIFGWQSRFSCIIFFSGDIREIESVYNCKKYTSGLQSRFSGNNLFSGDIWETTSGNKLNNYRID